MQDAGLDDETAQQFDEFHLDGVGVLKLVDEHELEPLAGLLADGRPVAEQVAGQSEQVVEVHDAGPPLAGLRTRRR